MKEYNTVRTLLHCGAAMALILGGGLWEKGSEAMAATRRLATSAQFSSQTNAYDLGERDHVASSNLSLNFNYKLNELYTTGLSIGGSQLHTQNTETEFSNTKVSFKRTPIVLKPKFKLSPSGAVTVATNYNDKRFYSYQGSASANIALLQATDSVIGPLDLSYGVGFRRNIHRLTRSAYDSPNIMHAFEISLGADKSINSYLSVELSAGLVANETYQSTRKNYYSLSQTLNIAVNKDLSIGLGHTNDANLLRPDGSRQSVDVFDNKTSSFFLLANIQI